MSILKVGVFVWIVVLLCIWGRGQQSNPSPAMAGNTLRTTSRLVVLDVVVTNQKGEPINNLAAGDFAVLEDGVPQTINSFEMPAIHVFPAPADDRKFGSGLNLIKNAEDSALTIFVLDEFNSSFEEAGYARIKLRQFLESHPRLGEPAELIRLTQFGISVVSDYTRDGNRLREVLERLPTQSAEMRLKGRTARLLDRAVTTIAAFNQIAMATKDHKGRKNVVWIGSGFPSSLHITGHPALLDTIQDTATHLQQAHVSVYVVNARGIPGYRDDYIEPGTSPVADAALYTGGAVPGYAGAAGGETDFVPFQDSTSGDVVFAGIAGQTGGKILANRNDLDVLIVDALTDGETYYALSYYPVNKNWNGAFRKIQVRLRPSSFTARTRKGYYATDDSNPTNDSIEATLALAVRSQVGYVGIPFDATAKISSGSSRFVHFKLRLDGHSLSWTALPNGDLRSEVTVVVADVLRNDKVVQSKILQKQLAVHRSATGRPDITSNDPVVLTAEAEAPSSASSRIRLVVRDATSGRIGTWDMPTDTIEGLEVSK